RGGKRVSWGDVSPLAVAAQCVPSLMPPGDSRGSGMRLLLVGKSRAGKMTTSNILLRERMFKFKSATKPVTVSCAQARCDGEDITVIDTADISDPREMYKEISHCIRLSSPGPHVLLLVTTLGQFIKEDKEATQKVQDISGADFEAHDHLTHAEDLARRPLHNFLRYCSNGVLQHLILQCGSRYCSFTNRGKWFSNDVYLEPRLTEKKVEHHVGRYKAERSEERIPLSLLLSRLSSPSPSPSVRYFDVPVVFAGPAPACPCPSGTQSTLLHRHVPLSSPGSLHVTGTYF
uniref:AIG1-type G domain-containing protein n=1 Tax=Strix occidentalis caurina TaxID=311401 RepID=A0A8D0FVP0_STROC